VAVGAETQAGRELIASEGGYTEEKMIGFMIDSHMVARALPPKEKT